MEQINVHADSRSGSSTPSTAAKGGVRKGGEVREDDATKFMQRRNNNLHENIADEAKQNEAQGDASFPTNTNTSGVRAGSHSRSSSPLYNNNSSSSSSCNEKERSTSPTQSPSNRDRWYRSVEKAEVEYEVANLCVSFKGILSGARRRQLLEEEEKKQERTKGDEYGQRSNKKGEMYELKEEEGEGESDEDDAPLDDDETINTAAAAASSSSTITGSADPGTPSPLQHLVDKMKSESRYYEKDTLKKRDASIFQTIAQQKKKKGLLLSAARRNIFADAMAISTQRGSKSPTPAGEAQVPGFAFRRQVQRKQRCFDVTKEHVYLRLSDDHPLKVYVVACRKYSLLPFHSILSRPPAGTRVDLAQSCLHDYDALAVAEYLKALACTLDDHKTRIEPHVNVYLEDNELDSKGAGEILDALLSFLPITSIETLNLAHNRLGEGAHGCRSLVPLLKYSMIAHLNLSQNGIGDSLVTILVKGLLACRSLKSLNLSRNDIRDCEGLAEVLSLYGQKIEDLDLSWNKLGARAGRAIAEAISDNTALRRLDLSYNNLKNSMQAFQAALRENTTLGDLDLSFNAINEVGCFSLMRNNPWQGLRVLRLNGNPLGPMGARIIIGLILNPPQDFSCTIMVHDCNFTLETLGTEEAREVQQEQRKMVASRGIEGSSSSSSSSSSASSSVSLSSSFNTKMIDRSDRLGSQLQMQAKIKAMDNETASHLLWVLQECFNHNIGRKLVVDALCSEGYAVTCLQALSIVSLFRGDSTVPSILVDSMTRLYPQTVDIEQWDDVVMTAVELHERKEFRQKIGAFYSFSATNPTGHYKLDLDTTGPRPCDRLVAQMLLSINIRERTHRINSKMIDLSQQGNWQNFRNETYNGKPFVYRAPTSGTGERKGGTTSDSSRSSSSNHTGSNNNNDDKGGGNGSGAAGGGNPRPWGTVTPFDLTEVGCLPSRGILELDYTSTTRPPETAVGIDQANLLTYLEKLEERYDRDRKEQLVCMRREFARHRYITCNQLKMIMKRFPESHFRVEIFVMFFSRIFDEFNFGVPLMLLNQKEQSHVYRRLGYLALLNPVDPYGYYELDLSSFEQRTVAQILVRLFAAALDRGSKQRAANFADLLVVYREAAGQQWKKCNAILEPWCQFDEDHEEREEEKTATTTGDDAKDRKDSETGAQEGEDGKPNGEGTVEEGTPRPKKKKRRRKDDEGGLPRVRCIASIFAGFLLLIITLISLS